VIAYPWAARRHDKSDFNDVLRAEGEPSIRWRILEALPRATSAETSL
jgi:hypothetical protein